MKKSTHTLPTSESRKKLQSDRDIWISWKSTVFIVSLAPVLLFNIKKKRQIFRFHSVRGVRLEFN